MLQQMEIKELSNTKKNLEFCRIMFRSPVLGYEKVKCTEMHFKKKVCLNLFFFSLAWAPVIMSNNLEKEKERKRASFIYNKSRGISIAQTVQSMGT